MSHFAEIDDNNIVIRVIVAEQDFIDTGAVGDPAKWIQTSYNTHGGIHYDPVTREPTGGTPLRKNYAGQGMIYDPILDAFYSPQPYPSWILNTDTCFWEPPVAYPMDGHIYEWNEEQVNWVIIN